ncbi:MAG: hydroxymethylpyrimidine/phosphomethylpyrimidine kinase [Pseudomonadota bacterium]
MQAQIQVPARPCVLVFAGVDPSGGAGISADIEAIAAMGAHALPVVTVLTVQDNDRVFAVHPVAAELVLQQAQALVDKISIKTVKIGIVGTRANAVAIASIITQLRQHNPHLPVVLDPVLASGHGDALSVDDAMQLLNPLLPLATLIAPNLPEARALCDGEISIESQAQQLRHRGCPHVLIKGGHGNGDDVVNRWFGPAASKEWHWPRLAGQFHGSGCTLASAIAGLLARGLDMRAAIEGGQEYCQKTLASAYAIAPGQRIPCRAGTMMN